MRHPAYNLKVNKEADRAVMIETIRRAIPVFGKESDYRYIGFGGPFLEDMKRIHSAFPLIKLISIEGNAETLKRQDFHRFINQEKLSLLEGKSHAYLRTQYEPQGKEIVWLDYLNFGREELSDFVFLATRVAAGSMLRITVRGEWKDKLPGLEPQSEWDKVYHSFRRNFGDLTPEVLEPDDFLDGPKYCTMLTKMVIAAVQDELAPPIGRYFQPLIANFYKDDTRMLSIMGVVADAPPAEKLSSIGAAMVDSSIVRAFNDWDLSSLDGETVHQLNVPSLSHKERLALDRHLPIENGEENTRLFLKELPYLVGDTARDHEVLLLRYAALSQYYSRFARVEW
jgi:hypothetical protein